MSNLSVLLKRSDQVDANKLPIVPKAESLNDGELAINYATDNETLFLRNSDGEVKSMRFRDSIDPNMFHIVDLSDSGTTSENWRGISIKFNSANANIRFTGTTQNSDLAKRLFTTYLRLVPDNVIENRINRFMFRDVYSDYLSRAVLTFRLNNDTTYAYFGTRARWKDLYNSIVDAKLRYVGYGLDKIVWVDFYGVPNRTGVLYPLEYMQLKNQTCTTNYGTAVIIYDSVTKKYRKAMTHGTVGGLLKPISALTETEKIIGIEVIPPNCVTPSADYTMYAPNGIMMGVEAIIDENGNVATEASQKHVFGNASLTSGTTNIETYTDLGRYVIDSTAKTQFLNGTMFLTDDSNAPYLWGVSGYNTGDAVFDYYGLRPNSNFIDICLQNGADALTDMDGYTNTRELINNSSISDTQVYKKMAKGCANYRKEFEKEKWYMPSCGELAYVGAISDVILSGLWTIREEFSGTTIDINDSIYSSTMCKKSDGTISAAILLSLMTTKYDSDDIYQWNAFTTSGNNNICVPFSPIPDLS